MSYISRHTVIEGTFKGHRVRVARCTLKDLYIVYIGRKAALKTTNLTDGLTKVFHAIKRPKGRR